MIASVYLPTFLGGLLAAWIGLMMWISNVKQRKRRETEKATDRQELLDAIREEKDQPVRQEND